MGPVLIQRILTVFLPELKRTRGFLLGFEVLGMAKISVSIPDELKDELDAFAEETGFKRSAAVAHILTAYFEGQVHSPVTATSFAQLREDLAQVQAYLEALHNADPASYPRPSWLPESRRSFIR